MSAFVLNLLWCVPSRLVEVGEPFFCADHTKSAAPHRAATALKAEQQLRQLRHVPQSFAPPILQA
jgi:hypothetical protein